MAKPIIKFTAVPYQIGSGTEIKTGYRPQLESQNGLYDLPFCKEVVNEKRLQTSPDELLHEMEMVAEVATTKVAEDGRPRGISKLLKWNRFAKGSLESPTSPWNESCKAEIRPQLLADATKIVDATFQNVNEGIGVRLNYVAWVGAKTVINVIKVGKSFAAYGNHMEFIAGDTAFLVVGMVSYPLTCTESDVAHAVFNWPAGLNPEAGTTAEFVMKSRGGIEEGEVYTSKKTVTVIAGDGPIVTDVSSEGHVNEVVSGTAFSANGSGLDAFAAGDTAKVKWTQGGEAKEASIVPAAVTAEKMSFEFPAALQSAPMGTELTFEITFGETVKSKDSTLVGV